MFSYGRYCPVVKSAEILGDRWTLLIITELLFGVHRFNELLDSLPGISRSVLSARLRRLEEVGVLERRKAEDGRGNGYFLTQAGEDLRPVVQGLGHWAARWVLSDPTARESDPDSLMRAISRHVRLDRLPPRRVVIRFDLQPPAVHGRRRRTYWLVLKGEDVSLCLQHPGFEPDLAVSSDSVSLFKVYMGRTTLARALREGVVKIEGPRALRRAFPDWMTWSHFSETVRRAAAARRPRA